ncbi:hypothetical protein CUR178_03844 [Leishmania enriettii]|uniref:Pleckstrin homology domain-containing protein n=1 Tax=Leishmania enriettii TaxID=5663 RepID=A0A836GKB7_LEIEN|nr:hypothetical protein CUR178_03844 [Leishmania enriettii]
MIQSVRHRYVDSGSPSYVKPLTFDVYDYDPREAGGAEQPQPSQQSLRRLQGCATAPQRLLSARSTNLTSRPIRVKRSCENASFTKALSSSVLQRSTHASSSSGTAASSPPYDDLSGQQSRTQRPAPASVPSESDSASVVSLVKNQHIEREHRRNQHRQHSNLPYKEHSPAARMTSPPVAPLWGGGSAPAAQPPQALRRMHGHRQRAPTSRVPGSSVLTGPGPTTISTSYPATGPLQSPSPIRNLSGGTERGDRAEDSAPLMNNITPGSTTMLSSLPSAPFHERQARAPVPPRLSPASRRSAVAVAGSGRATASGSAVGAPVPGKADAQLEANKDLRRRRRENGIREQGYVAQTAYTQRNPFRSQDFAEFATNPQYRPPPGFDVYPQVMDTRVYGLEVSRASRGAFMKQRLVDAAHPSTAEERAEMEVLLGETLEKLQAGDWFYKWTRVNHVHQRYVWLNMQRGTLMWSPSPRKSIALNSEVKLSTVRSITPECLQLDGAIRVFYRMNISTHDRYIRLATEIREKFDLWYRVLLQLTVPNLTYDEPGMWGRPSRSVNVGEWGSMGRWASRYSPLTAIMDHASGAIGPHETYVPGALSSSD